MHEAGIAAEIIQLAGDIARQNGLYHVERVVVAIGGFAGVEASSLLFAFQVLSQSSLVDGAELVIEPVGTLLRCSACESEYAAELDELACPVCGSQDFSILHGRELVLRTISGVRDEQRCIPSGKTRHTANHHGGSPPA